MLPRFSYGMSLERKRKKCERNWLSSCKHYLLVFIKLCLIVDNIFSLEIKLYYQKGFVSVCTCMIECVYVCVRVRWVVGHLQLQAVYVCPSGKVLFSLSSRGPQAVCGGYLFTLSQGTLFYCQCKHIPVLWKLQTNRKILHIHSWSVAPF